MPTECPYCGGQNDLVTAVPAKGDDRGMRVPKAGSVSACSQCGRLAVFEETLRGMALRVATDEEALAMNASEQLQKVTAAVRGVNVSEAVRRWRRASHAS